MMSEKEKEVRERSSRSEEGEAAGSSGPMGTENPQTGDSGPMGADTSTETNEKAASQDGVDEDKD